MDLVFTTSSLLLKQLNVLANFGLGPFLNPRGNDAPITVSAGKKVFLVSKAKILVIAPHLFVFSNLLYILQGILQLPIECTVCTFLTELPPPLHSVRAAIQCSSDSDSRE